MRRVSRQACEDGPLLEEQETEGQRQLHSLLLQQLHTDVDIERCVAKKQCFAPAALYRPFGDQAAGVRSLSQFQALQDGEKELASLRELGLTEAEIQLWRSRDAPEAGEKSHGVCAAPAAKQQRLQVIRDKIDARDELLSRPQRFAASQPLSRREMEIERALFQGNDRLGFLTALYHRDEDNQSSQQGAASSNPLDNLYRDVLGEERLQTSRQEETPETSSSSLRTSTHRTEDTTEWQSAPSDTDTSQPAAPTKVEINQPIGSLRGAARAGSEEPFTLRGEIETITDEEIRQNRDSDDAIRNIPRFRNYQAGKPSKVLCVKNLSAQASVAQLVALFSRFEPVNGPPVVYRLLTGRLKGQAFVTLPDTETAQNALWLIHGYRLLGKPLVVEFGRERQEVEKVKETK
ncbi:RNA-binding protein 41 [Solea solea]|uniref:RNA-binding protein 41 n=1 Tax=Solea solea TaxID=90069 RepID=UPI00272B1B8E|nr:RNA-binding protein 41 [Solea solea]